MQRIIYKLGVLTDGRIKDTLSWSGYSLWKSSKASYRKRYYENEKPFETKETVFGKRVADMLEKDSSVIGSETRIMVTLKTGLKLLSYIDSFDEENLYFEEYKTGHLSPTGKVPWTQSKVEKHKQLDWYSLMIKKKYGKVTNKTKLIWLETRFKTDKTTFDGHVLETQSRELELTGKRHEFIRRVYQWQRDKLEKDILLVAEEITKDYERYQQERASSGSAEVSQ